MFSHAANVAGRRLTEQVSALLLSCWRTSFLASFLARRPPPPGTDVVAAQTV